MGQENMMLLVRDLYNEFLEEIVDKTKDSSIRTIEEVNY